jgi:HTH-type transcriptional regulator / antitoxin HigA
MDIDKIKIKPVKTEKDYKRTMKIIESLMECAPNSKEEDLLEVLSILADEYEKNHYPIEQPDPIEFIKYRMEQLHLSKKDLAKYLGGANRVSEVLSKKRPLTLRMIKNLYHHLQIPAETLLAS